MALWLWLPGYNISISFTTFQIFILLQFFIVHTLDKEWQHAASRQDFWIVSRCRWLTQREFRVKLLFRKCKLDYCNKATVLLCHPLVYVCMWPPPLAQVKMLRKSWENNAQPQPVPPARAGPGGSGGNKEIISWFAGKRNEIKQWS